MQHAEQLKRFENVPDMKWRQDFVRRKLMGSRRRRNHRLRYEGACDGVRTNGGKRGA